MNTSPLFLSLPPSLWNSNEFKLLFLLTSCLGFCSVGGFKQELWLYEQDGNALHFQAHVPDTSIYYPVLKNVYRYCARGKWFVYDVTNFQNISTGLGLAFTPDLICQKVNVSQAQSFRFWGAQDTSVAAISLYSGERFDGKEVLVKGRAHAGIPFEVKSIAATGTVNWRLFEGEHLDGRSVCYRVPATEGYNYNFDRVKALNDISGIRSVFKGCDMEQLHLYRSKFMIV